MRGHVQLRVAAACHRKVLQFNMLLGTDVAVLAFGYGRLGTGGSVWGLPSGLSWGLSCVGNWGSVCTTGVGRGLQNRWNVSQPGVQWVRFPYTSAIFSP